MDGKTLLRVVLAVILLVADAGASSAQPLLSDEALIDEPVSIRTADDLDELEWAIAPYVRLARETYPQAKERFLRGLPDGEHFFLTTRQYDKNGRKEQVFVAVQSIRDGTVQGFIYNPRALVSGYSFPESEVYDWLISKPDGSEEGNIVGNFLDSYRERAH